MPGGREREAAPCVTDIQERASMTSAFEKEIEAATMSLSSEDGMATLSRRTVAVSAISCGAMALIGTTAAAYAYINTNNIDVIPIYVEFHDCGEARPRSYMYSFFPLSKYGFS